MSNIKTSLKKIGNNLLRWYKLAGLYVLKFFHRFYLPIILVVSTIVIMFAEWKLLTYPTNDLVGIVFGWVRSIKTHGFKSFWKTEADYSPIFLFMCAIVSLLPAGKEVTVNNTTFEYNYIIYFKVFYLLCAIGMAIG